MCVCDCQPEGVKTSDGMDDGMSKVRFGTVVNDVWRLR